MGKHRETRKRWKKLQRKRKRQVAAIEYKKIQLKFEEERSKSPSYQLWLKNQNELEEFQEKESKRIEFEEYKKWEEKELQAMIEWELLQKKLENLKQEKAKKELLIKEEWEREQKKIKDNEEKRIAAEKYQEEINRKFMEEIEMYISGLGPLPSSLETYSNTRPDQPLCPFFSKVAACRFRDNCSRNHCRPSLSDTLLIPNFYKNFELNMRYEREFDIDIGLECDEKEAYEKFYEFYDDIVSELKSYGKIIELNVCRNHEQHLLGNVYVQYRSKRYALKAYRSLCGRYYGGRQITAEFCNIPSWSEAICGLFFRKLCPKGKNCNYLHLYKNPGFKYQSKHNRKQDEKLKSINEDNTGGNLNRRDRSDSRNSSRNLKTNNSFDRNKRHNCTSEKNKIKKSKWENSPNKHDKNLEVFNWSSDDD
ncbi:U2 small nuclear ribonucleoprotein auxiliary factor 35 kDa subunit-related protein 2 [Daktulosphaira vitifoliae]|uniref:U2 small nuclear ribonucleoprotein auxiliary factor 35 kDa subunit-related protein 2 n=1 Tax=Daktulosphaira vitifoliae TaxID=58002 RepID=UPI0021AAD8FE|nr:U2 small nuclear ribonucleoprotein auxiliary factor 35 kDa subunit-related protein 2 [Daktulosphaira vitifoliae]